MPAQDPTTSPRGPHLLGDVSGLCGVGPASGNAAIYLSFVSPVSLFSRQNCGKLNIYSLYKNDMLGV